MRHYNEAEAVGRLMCLMAQYGTVSIARIVPPLEDCDEPFVLLSPVFRVVGDVPVIPHVILDGGLHWAIQEYGLVGKLCGPVSTRAAEGVDSLRKVKRGRKRAQ